MLRPWIAFLAAALPIAGCGLFSDFHTGGFALVDSGSANCTSAKDCDAGEVCCVATASPAAATCRPAPCPNVTNVGLPVQLCQSSNECGTADCAVQSCQFLGQGIDIAACGVIATCSATPLDGATLFDAAAPPPGVDAAPPQFDAAIDFSD